MPLPPQLIPPDTARDKPAEVEIRTASLSIVVPVHFGGEAFRACVAALLEALHPRDELIVVADGVTDGAWQDLVGTRARLVVSRQTWGPAHARNRGAREATGDVLLFVDADCLVHPDTLNQIRERFSADPHLDALIGSYDDAPAAPGLVSQYRNLLHHHTHQRGPDDVTTFWGACGAVRREAFDAVGGFDETYRTPSIEDVEFGARLVGAGYRIRLMRNVQVKHLKQWTAASLIRTDVLARAAPWTELLLRHRTVGTGLSLSWQARLSTVFVCALPSLAVVLHTDPALIPVAALAVLSVVAALNVSFYAFLWRTRGAGFAVRAVPWHLVYFGCSGVGAAVGLIRYLRADVQGHPRLHGLLPQDV